VASIVTSPSTLPTDGAASELQRSQHSDDGRHCGGANLPAGAGATSTANEKVLIPRHETFPTAEGSAQLVGRACPRNKKGSRARYFVGAVSANLDPHWDAESLQSLVDLFRLLNAWYEEDRR
jgi:hypothetical protein